MNKTIKSLGLLAFTALIFSACTTAEKEEVVDVVKEEVIDMDEVRVQIQAMEDAYAAGEKAKDADAVAAYYSEDAISYSQNKKPVSGRSAIKEKIAKEIASDTTDNYNVYKIVDLFAEGNTALEIGSWTEFDSSGNELDNGNYMSYFEKQDGKYICIRDMSTTETPLKSNIEVE